MSRFLQIHQTKQSANAIACRSGQLNAKQRKLMELQALAQSRMAAMQANFAQGIKDAKDVQRDLKWTQERVQ